MLSSALHSSPKFLAVGFDAPEARVKARGKSWGLSLPLCWLGGARTEAFLNDAVYAGEEHGFSLYESGDLLIGFAVVPCGPSLKKTSSDVYRRLFLASAGCVLYRVWNYVPGINATGPEGENYRAFCEGRSQAFEAAHGQGFKRTLPSASAVGCAGTQLAVVFVAGRSPAQQIENPEQVPAYEYPAEHGPRPPSFSRATVAADGKSKLVFVSGTASIKGHVTVAPSLLQPQLDCTLHNLGIVSKAAGLGADLGASMPGASRFFKVYLRHAEDFGAVRDRLERELIRPDDHAVYLQADICRAALNVEIEATVRV